MSTIAIPIVTGLLAQILLAWMLSDNRRSFIRLASFFILADIFAAGFMLAAWILLAGFGINR